MFLLIIRTVILYIFLLFAMRLMGKRQLGQLDPLDLVTALMISELGVLPMEDNRLPLINSIVPIMTILTLQVLISLIVLKNNKARSILNGEPSILIKDGKIDIEELRNQRFNLDDLLEELRLNGYFDLNDIHYVILETNGNISIMPKANAAPVTPSNLDLKTEDKEIPLLLISDGVINKDNLRLIKKDIHWLDRKLKAQNINSYKDVFIAMSYDNNKLFVQLKKVKNVSK